MLIEGVMAIQRIIDEDNIPLSNDGQRQPLGINLATPTTNVVDITIDAS
jgi:hypothetical protein